jgi:hypothetical protein
MVAINSGVKARGIISVRQHVRESERYEEPIAVLARDAGVPCLETEFLHERDYSALIREQLRPGIAYLVGVRVVVRRNSMRIFTMALSLLMIRCCRSIGALRL